MTQMPSYRPLRRSQTNRTIGGVCGGIAEYTNLDPTVVRLITIALAIFTGGGVILAYLLALVFMPDAPATAPVWHYATQPGQPGHPGQSQPGPQDTP
jgi:phage shock protein PspC (stress-responsive transcriptional regulator)